MQTFDTHEYIKELQNAGVPLTQAEAHSKALKRVFDLEELATKQDLQELQEGLNTEMSHLETRLNTKIDSAIISLIKWLVPLFLGQTGLFFLLMKFFNSSPAGN